MPRHSTNSLVLCNRHLVRVVVGVVVVLLVEEAP